MKSQSFVVLVALIGALGGLLFGYDTGVISGAIIFIQPAFALSDDAKAFVVSVVLIGAMIGAVAAGPISDAYGRRLSLIGAGLVFAIGAMISAFAPPPDTALLDIGRFVVGLAIGISSVTAPLYVSEASPAASRGALVSLYQFAITVGILAAQVVDYLLAASKNWQLMLGLAIVPSVLLVAGMTAMPESPRWLIAKGRRAEGRAVLERTRPPDEVEAAERDITAMLDVHRGSWLDLLKPEVRTALVIGVGLAVLQQVTGINTVIYYGPQIFKIAGFSSDATALLATMGVGIVNVVMTVVAIVLIDRLGRKPLLYAGVGGMMLALLALAYAFAHPGAPAQGGVTVASLMVYVGCFAFGLGPITWVLISEIYPLRVRGRGMAVATFANWAANFGVSVAFLRMLSALGSVLTFVCYAAMCLVTLVVIRFAIPETRALELESISARKAA